ncbi:MAG TPA: SpoIIE family protein phosphatase, partial [Gemmatimonadales bacterium]
DHDLLCLWTDGLVDAESADGERFGEGRLIRWLVALRDRPVAEIVATVMDEVERHAVAPADDRTLLVLRS